ncbi:MAG: YihY/virulence factor BrkB family protein [Clostridium sp.]|uniref:YihY/virulence factor BrkB family protein n=1 Tax=Clostridium sp. TaxID=1506 RepID=UPI001ED497A8|nr:YihY/virulence factor BrkB family protein [Clostridium sp.]MBS5886053.1 YihY/virulence factor BrkB family protein [Clostridium sp.]MDU7149441.1 YihY/virulence factor BrkB family protein [Clostridium sp.]MDU7242545.1 YihY/virulence factor BrkB family protein [Clostridium sp.]
MSKIKNDNKRSVMDSIIYFIVKVNNDDIFALGAQLAYYLILAFFPFLIFLLTLVGFSRLNSADILDGLRTILPNNVFTLVDTTVVEIVDTQNAGLLGASIALSMWSASSGFRAVIKGVNKAYDIREHRSFIKRAFIAIFFTLALALIIMLTLAMLVFGEIIGKYLISVFPFQNILRNIWNISRYIVVILAMIWIFACIYRYTPARKIPWKEVFPGAIVSTLGWIVVSIAFSYYINNIANYSRLYGSVGAVFILMTWLYITSMILILGAEINSVLSIRKSM